MKSYYYAAIIDPPKDRSEIYEYYKSYSKKQIKKHCENNGWQVVKIYDPTDKPVHGIFYQDVTEVFVEKINTA